MVDNHDVRRLLMGEHYTTTGVTIMLQEKTLSYYDWDDIEAHLCDKMGIRLDQFRDYHEVVGGGYKDWWHVWLKLVSDDVVNDSVKHVYGCVLDWDGAVNQYGDWVLSIKPYIDEIIGESSIYVYYSW